MDPARKRLFIGIAVVLVLAAVFAAGWWPATSRARAAREETERVTERLQESQATLAQTQFDLQVARLRGNLGEVLHETNANNYGIAAERATAFFDGLRDAVNSAQLAAGERRTVLTGILDRRDEISADLARAEPAVKAKLTEMYMQLGGAEESP